MSFESGLHMFSYPINFVPRGPSCRIRLTVLSPSLRGGRLLGRCSLLNNIHAAGRKTKKGNMKKRVSFPQVAGRDSAHSRKAPYGPTNAASVPNRSPPHRSDVWMIKNCANEWAPKGKSTTVRSCLLRSDPAIKIHYNLTR